MTASRDEAPAPSPADLIARLRRRGWRIGVAESLTGGDLTSSLVGVPGASAVLRGGIVAYATDLKARLLGVDPDLLAREGAVHPEVALQMARGVRIATAPDAEAIEVGLATTGVAGPDAQDGVPVGRVFVAIVTPDHEQVVGFDLEGDRSAVRAGARDAALDLLRISL